MAAPFNFIPIHATYSTKESIPSFIKHNGLIMIHKGSRQILTNEETENIYQYHHNQVINEIILFHIKQNLSLLQQTFENTNSPIGIQLFLTNQYGKGQEIKCGFIGDFLLKETELTSKRLQKEIAIQNAIYKYLYALDNHEDYRHRGDKLRLFTVVDKTFCPKTYEWASSTNSPYMADVMYRYAWCNSQNCSKALFLSKRKAIKLNRFIRFTLQ